MSDLDDPCFGMEEEERRQERLKRQADNDDYSFTESGGVEKCECGASINSHGHCPRCDY